MIHPNFLLLILPLVLCQCAAPPSDFGLAGDHLRPCPVSPNCVNSEAESGRARIKPLIFMSSSDQAWQNLQRAVGETGGEIVAEESNYLRAVYTSRLFRFKDDVEFRLDRSGKIIHLRSASRTGYWDLGVNQRRVERIRLIFKGLDERKEREQ